MNIFRAFVLSFLVVITQLGIRIKEHFEHCPACHAQTDRGVHGYNHAYKHCFNCGWCEYARKFGHEDCGVRHA